MNKYESHIWTIFSEQCLTFRVAGASASSSEEIRRKVRSAGREFRDELATAARFSALQLEVPNDNVFVPLVATRSVPPRFLRAVQSARVRCIKIKIRRVIKKFPEFPSTHTLRATFEGYFLSKCDGYYVCFREDVGNSSIRRGSADIRSRSSPGAEVAAQNCSATGAGAFTGEVNAAQARAQSSAAQKRESSQRRYFWTFWNAI